MKALLKESRGPGNVHLTEMPIPKPEPGYALVKVACAAISAPDRGIINDTHVYHPPLVMGRYFSGVIEDLGEKVPSWQTGERVMVEVRGESCGRCPTCMSGRPLACMDNWGVGWGMNGGFAQYVQIPYQLFHRLPKQVSDEEGALIEPAARAVEAVFTQGKISSKDNVVILGCGVAGLLVLQASMQAGAGAVYVVGKGTDENIRFPLAEKLGATKTINGDAGDPVKVVKEQTDGRGADVVIESSADKTAIEQGYRMLNRTGRFITVGLAKSSEKNIPWTSLNSKSIQSWFHSSCGHKSYEKAISMVQSGQLQLKPLITERFSLENWEQAFRKSAEPNSLAILLCPEHNKNR